MSGDHQVGIFPSGLHFRPQTTTITRTLYQIWYQQLPDVPDGAGAQGKYIQRDAAVSLAAASLPFLAEAAGVALTVLVVDAGHRSVRRDGYGVGRGNVQHPVQQVAAVDFLPNKFHSPAEHRRIYIPVSKVNLAEKFSQVTQYWNPQIVSELNGQHVKVVKLKGEFVWHHHDHEDEMFLTIKGRFRVELRDRTVWLDEGEFLTVPRGTEHRPVADEEAWVLLFEPTSTLNTGNVENELTRHQLQRL